MAFDLKYKEGNNLEILLFGDLDINNVECFENSVLNKYKELNQDIILDLKSLDYIDSTGLGSIIKIYKEARDKEKTITIKNSKRNIRKLFSITELDQLFNMED